MRSEKAKKTAARPKGSDVTPSRRVTARKNRPISAAGWEVFLRWIPISERDFQRLTVEGASVDDVKARFSKRRGVFLDACKLRDIGLQREGSAILQFGGNAKYFLVAEDWEKKEFVKGKTGGLLDRSKLRFSVARCAIIANGTSRNIVCFGYNADAEPDLDLFDGGSKKTIYSVVTRANERHRVIFNDK